MQVVSHKFAHKAASLHRKLSGFHLEGMLPPPRKRERGGGGWGGWGSIIWFLHIVDSIHPKLRQSTAMLKFKNTPNLKPTSIYVPHSLSPKINEILCACRLFLVYCLQTMTTICRVQNNILKMVGHDGQSTPTTCHWLQTNCYNTVHVHIRWDRKPQTSLNIKENQAFYQHK